MTIAPILKLVDPNKDFVVCTDACKEGLGGVLMQEGHVNCYEYRNLKEHEKNYFTHDLKWATIIHAFKMWRHYLIGGKFQLRTYNVSPKYLFDQPSLNARQERWLEFISEYDFEITHIKEKENKIVDALRRKLNQICATSSTIWSTNLIDKINMDASYDLEYLKIKEEVHKTKTLDKEGSDFLIDSQDILLF